MKRTTDLGGAELFLIFILQPEIAAHIVNVRYHPMAVDRTLIFNEIWADFIKVIP